jgi:hypothetical protein
VLADALHHPVMVHGSPAARYQYFG